MQYNRAQENRFDQTAPIITLLPQSRMCWWVRQPLATLWENNFARAALFEMQVRLSLSNNLNSLIRVQTFITAIAKTLSWLVIGLFAHSLTRSYGDKLCKGFLSLPL
jgi:hypothetical protein